MEEEQPNNVIVGDTVGLRLSKSLEGSGKTYDPGQLQHRIRNAVWRSWGTQAKLFQDAHGGGWIIEVSDAVDGIETFAIIRTIHGTRMVVNVVELEEMQMFERSGSWSDDESNGLDKELIAAMNEIEGINATQPPAPEKPGPKGDDRRLIVWWERGPKSRSDGGSTPSLKEVSLDDAEGEVLALLMKGFEVKVWQAPTTPRLKVSL